VVFHFVSTNFLKQGKAVAAFCLYGRAGRGERGVGWAMHCMPEGRGSISDGVIGIFH
jgi:hypothetical protein